jgi:hypothetical protein
MKNKRSGVNLSVVILSIVFLGVSAMFIQAT